MQQQTALKPLPPDEIHWMRAHGDSRAIGELRGLHRQGVDVRANSPAYRAQVATTIKSNVPAHPKPTASAQSSSPAPLSEHQVQVLKNVMGQQPAPPASRSQGDFMSLVDAHQKNNGCKRSESIGAIAADNPQLHKQWLQAQQTSGPVQPEPGPQQKASEHEFTAQAKRLSAEQSMPLSKAMGELARRDPALHQRFLQEVNT